MKLSELFLTDADKANTSQLKNSIDNGKKVSIYNSSVPLNGYGWRDLEDLGYAQQNDEYEDPTHKQGHYTSWTYTGSNPKNLLYRVRDSSGKLTYTNKILKNGDKNQ